MKKSRKVENKELATKEGALSLIPQGGVSLATRKEETLKSPFLPYLCFGHPKNAIHKDYTLALIKDGAPTVLDVPEITHVFSSEMVRFLEGSAYTKRLYSHLPRQAEEFAKALEDMEKDEESPWQKGLSHLVFILNKDVETFATMEGVGSLEGYTIKLFADASVNENQKVKILLQDHSKNLKESKKGFNYLAHWKLSAGLDFQIENLTPEDQELVKMKYEQQKEQLDMYLK